MRALSELVSLVVGADLPPSLDSLDKLTFGFTSSSNASVGVLAITFATGGSTFSFACGPAPLSGPVGLGPRASLCFSNSNRCLSKSNILSSIASCALSITLVVRPSGSPKVFQKYCP